MPRGAASPLVAPGDRMNRPLNSKQLAALRPLWPDSSPREFQAQADRLAEPDWKLDRTWWLCMAARCQRQRRGRLGRSRAIWTARDLLRGRLA